jgi:hypothetical protein
MKNTFTAIAYTAKTDGYKALTPPWAPGWSWKCFETACFNMVFHYWYEFFRSWHERSLGEIGFFANMAISMVAAALNQTTTSPLQNISVKLQVDPDRSKTLSQHVRELYTTEGLEGFYKGLPAAIALSINAAMNMSTFEWLKDLVLARTNKQAVSAGGKVSVGLSITQGFFVGMLSKAIAASTCYPITRIKVMCMSQTKKSKKKAPAAGEEGAGAPAKLLTPMQMARKVHAEGGWKAFFYGLEGQVFNASLKQALMFTVKENIQVLLLAIFLPEKLKAMRLKAAASAS